MAPRYNWKRGASACVRSANNLLDEKKKILAHRYNWKRGVSACVRSADDLLDEAAALTAAPSWVVNGAASRPLHTAVLPPYAAPTPTNQTPF